MLISILYLLISTSKISKYKWDGNFVISSFALDHQWLLFEQIQSVSNVKEEVYGALDSFVAWELEFPLIAVKKALRTLEFQGNWIRIIQVGSLLVFMLFEFPKHQNILVFHCFHECPKVFVIPPMPIVNLFSNSYMCYLTNVWPKFTAYFSNWMCNFENLYGQCIPVFSLWGDDKGHLGR